MSTTVALPQAPRLLFRCWAPGDLADAMAIWGDPRVTTFIDARPRLSAQDVAARLEREIENQRRYGFQYWRLQLRTTEALVGCAGLKPREGEPGMLELGFHLCPAFWGQGLATEAATAVVAHAFAALCATGLFAGHHPRNEASRRVLEKLGFVHTHDELFPPTGLLHPGYRLGASNWGAEPGPPDPR